MYKNIISQTEFQRNNKKFEKLLEKGEVIVVKNNKPSFVAIKAISYPEMKETISKYQMWSLGKIIQELRNKEGFFKSKGIESLSIFGSYSRGEENASSDLDVVYTSKETGVTLIGLSEHIDNSIKNLKVDSLPLKGLKNEFIESIKKDLINVF